MSVKFAVTVEELTVTFITWSVAHKIEWTVFFQFAFYTKWSTSCLQQVTIAFWEQVPKTLFISTYIFNGWVWPTHKMLRGIHMGHMIAELGSVPRGGYPCPCTQSSAWGHAASHAVGTRGYGIKWPGGDTDHYPPTSAEFYTSTSPYFFIWWYAELIKHREKFTFILPLPDYAIDRV